MHPHMSVVMILIIQQCNLGVVDEYFADFVWALSLCIVVTRLLCVSITLTT